MRPTWILAFLLLVGRTLFTARYAFAQSADYWYVESIKVGNIGLPDGIEIIASDPTSQPRGYLTLTNDNDQPVYVMSLGYKDVLVMPTPDANWKSRLNAAHEAASYLAAPNRPVHLSIEGLTSLDQDLADKNVLGVEPPPIDLPIPDTQSSELLLVYDGQVIEVPFTLSYTINPKYGIALTLTPEIKDGVTATLQPAAADHTAGEKLIVPGMVGAAALIMIGFLVWRVLKGR